ncbi:MAG: hypothetical protein ACYSUK_02330 [Planctomycetota bacterium]|jgi:hypothetical protein
MAEEIEKAKKKEGMTKKIIRWIWRVFLVAVLILGLWFRAPVKALCVPMIFLLGCSALPRVYRKWFWVGVAVVIIGCAMWVFLPGDNEGWQIYKYDFSKELEALEVIHAIPDDENAALLYQELLANYEINEPNIPDINLSWDLRGEPWRSEDYPEQTKWLEEQEPIIKELLEISQMEKCLFPLHDPFEMVDRFRYSSLRQCAYLLLYSANNDVGEGRINEALKKYEAIIRIGKHFNQQPTMIDTLVGTADEALGLGQMKKLVFLEKLTDEELNQIEGVVKKSGFEWKEQFPRILEHEKLSDKSFFARFYEVNEDGKTRFARDPLADYRESYRKQLSDINEPNELKRYQYNNIKKRAYPSYWEIKLFKAGVLFYWFSMPESPEKMSVAIDKVFENIYSMAETDYCWTERHEFTPLMSLFSFRALYNPNYLKQVLCGLTINSFHGLHRVYLRKLSDKNGVLVLISIRRYKDENGLWPESLEEIQDLADEEVLIDPVNGSNFVYKVTEDGVMLYSKGENNIDDNGKRERNFGSFDSPEIVNADCDDRIIWPIERIDKEGEDGE